MRDAAILLRSAYDWGERQGKQLSLDRRDVTSGFLSSARVWRHRTPGKPRIGAQRVFLRHKPTGVEVSGELPARGGPYSKRGAQAARRVLTEQLYRQLEDDVAKALRTRGR